MIGLTGQKGVGKSMVASYLEEHHDFVRLAFADSLKEAAKIIFQLNDHHVYTREGKQEHLPRWDRTPRDILQLLGTEVGRQIDEDVWVKSVGAKIEDIPHDRIVVEDVRFQNEADFLREKGFTVWGIRRPGYYPDWPDPHASEFEMWTHWHQMTDTTFANASTKSSLFAMIEKELCTDTKTTTPSS